MSKKVRRCVLCGAVLPKGEYGNNPEPLKPFSSGVCCNDCNMNKVIPARLAAIPREELEGDWVVRDKEPL